MSKWYGSISNRLEEGRNYNEDKLIHEGDDINIYHYSDVSCAYVEKVIDQKHLLVRPYYVCADHSKAGGQGHQDWLYFKTLNEHNHYISSVFKDKHYVEDAEEPKAEEWVLRYNKWNRVIKFTQKKIDEIKAREGWCCLCARNAKEQALLDEGKEVTHYIPLNEKVSFGKDIKSYYYDWAF